MSTSPSTSPQTTASPQTAASPQTTASPQTAASPQTTASPPPGMSAASSAEATLVMERYRRYGATAAVVCAGAWHFGFDLVSVVTSTSSYRWPVLVVASWLVHTAVGAWCATALVRGRTRPWPAVWATTALVISAVVLANCPPPLVISPANWGWGSVGWLAVLVLWGSRIRVLVMVLVGNAAVMLAGMVVMDVVDHESLSAYLMVIAGTMALQLGVAAGIRALMTTGASVSARSAQLTRTVLERARADAAHAARSKLGRAVHADTLPLLEDLAAGVDPADPAVRHRCAVSAARLRRLILETHNPDEPLGVDLRACADVATRRGVVVDLEVHGHIPRLPRDVRRALVEAPLIALAGTRTHARVTVAAIDGSVIVSVRSDAVDFELPQSPLVTVERYVDQDTSWVDSRWPPVSRAEKLSASERP